MASMDKWGDKISPFDDLIDTRNVLERIDEIESEYLDDDSGEVVGMGDWTIADRAEWQGLTGIIRGIGEEASRNGVTMIRESYFRDHIKEEFTEIGGEYWEQNPRYPGGATRESEFRRIPLDELYSRLPFSHIDWDAVAEDCRHDYSTYEFEGVTYYYSE